MKSLLLLILSLMTGCEASSDVKGCPGGWVEFTCTYPKQKKTYEMVKVDKSKLTLIESRLKNNWVNKDRFSLYHDTNAGKLRVVIKQLKREDSGEYKCKFCEQANSCKKEEVDIGKKFYDGCQKGFNQTAYRTAKTTITCDHPGNKYESSVKFFCKENEFICEDILSTKSSKSNGTFTLTETNSGFSMSISNVSSHHTGVYWCGVETNGGRYRAALRKIQLKVEDITTFTRSPMIGQNFTYWCSYPNGAPIKKFICKGEDPSMCKYLASTAQLNNNTGKFSMKVDKEKRNITITVREVTTADTGTYWCGAESTDGRYSNQFVSRLMLTAVPSTTLTPIISPTTLEPAATSAVSSTQSISVSAESDGGSRSTAIIAAVVCVAVLLLLLILVLLYKRSERSKNTDGGAQNNEERTYEEIQERPQKPDSGTALKTIYTTANFPTNPTSAPHHYSSIDFKSSSGEVRGDTYSTVHDVQHPTYSNVNHPSRLSADPFYSTVNHPQQH